jgi:hypothetical protein
MLLIGLVRLVCLAMLLTNVAGISIFDDRYNGSLMLVWAVLDLLTFLVAHYRKSRGAMQSISQSPTSISGLLTDKSIMTTLPDLEDWDTSSSCAQISNDSCSSSNAIQCIEEWLKFSKQAICVVERITQ